MNDAVMRCNRGGCWDWAGVERRWREGRTSDLENCGKYFLPSLSLRGLLNCFSKRFWCLSLGW